MEPKGNGKAGAGVTGAKPRGTKLLLPPPPPAGVPQESQRSYLETWMHFLKGWSAVSGKLQRGSWKTATQFLGNCNAVDGKLQRSFWETAMRFCSTTAPQNFKIKTLQCNCSKTTPRFFCSLLNDSAVLWAPPHICSLNVVFCIQIVAWVPKVATHLQNKKLHHSFWKKCTACFFFL